ncbi:MAG: starch synthase [Betaproteobacteria bacterium RIFCSPLOWO2_12_FULL_63_13]|nr:MAG: starch synthase [Betaproteobacteria bacterium RIFCSPLOWO2_12_FULL_63_13]
MTAESIRVLFATSECAPLIKTGGLADVSSALPAALTRLGVDIRVLLPGYRAVMGRLSGAREVARLAATPRFPHARLLLAEGPGGVPLVVVDCPELYDRPGGPYQDPSGADWPDNALRFGQFSRVAAELSGVRSPLGWQVQVLHCNDWQTGLAPAYLRLDPDATAATLLTIHNLAFQGVFPPQVVPQLGLPPESFSPAGVEYYGQMSFLKAAIRFADAVSTVSPTYAEEIQREPLGMGLQGLLAERRGDLEGILNGIDIEAWNPERDPLIARRFGIRSLDSKRDNKWAVQQRFGLTQDSDVPLLAVISRLAYQKGIDLVLEAAEALLALPSQLVVLGKGDRDYETRLLALAARHRDRVAVMVGFNEELAHLIEAGADMFLMPSRYEPCGMNQMYSLHYGTIPVVRATGGLVDSVVNCKPETLSSGTANGFVFDVASTEALLGAVSRALEGYRNPGIWRALQVAGMRRDFNWDASARRYLAIYTRLAKAQEPNSE